MEVAEELKRIQRDQGRLQDDLDCSCDGLAVATKDVSDCRAAHEARGVKLCNAFREVCNRRATHEVICVEAKKALHRTLEIKRKASEVEEGLSTHRERTRRISNEHARAEGMEATELIEAWQHQLLSGQPMSGPPFEPSEVILVERQR